MRRWIGWILIPAALVAADHKIPPTRPAVQGVSPRGAQRGTDLEVTISGSNLQGASEIRFANPKLRA